MKVLDLFCCAGGCSMGYHRAGYEVIGVDNKPQPHYPFTFVQADATTYPLDGFDLIHASPPCQAYSAITNTARNQYGIEYPDLVAFMRHRLTKHGTPWVIENVVGAPVHSGIMLCGSMFGLKVRRHRYFETSHFLFTPANCKHNDDFVTIVGNKVFRSKRNPTWTGLKCGVRSHLMTDYPFEYGFTAMGIDWEMTPYELCQAIPPVYTQYVGEQMKTYLHIGVR